MGIEIKTDFETLEDAIAWLTETLKPEVESLEGEKVALLKKRDELLGTQRKLKDRFSKFEAYADQDLDIAELLRIKDQHESGSGDLEEKYKTAYQADKSKFEQRIKALEDERAAEKAQAEKDKEAAAAALIKSEAIAELSKPAYSIRNPQQFWMLFINGNVSRNDAGQLVVGDEYKSLPLADRIKEIEMDEENLHHFKASGTSGAGSAPNTGGGKGQSNPWKAGQINLTEQGKIFRTNPDLARRLKAEAKK